MQTYLQFRTRIKKNLFPTGEPLSLVGPHDAAFQTAMLDLQQWVPCLKQFNVSTWASADRQWENAKSVVNAPFGQVRRVYAIAGGTDTWRDKVYYGSATLVEVECWARRLYQAVTPANKGMPVLPMGYKFEEASSDWQQGRARAGIWAIDRKRLYIAPWLQSYETLVVVWDGEKNEWQDSDGVDETYWRKDAELAVEYYVAFRHHMSFGDRAQAPDFLKLYEEKRAKLIYWCRENTRRRETDVCNSEGGGDALVGRTADQSQDDKDPIEDTTEQDHVLFNAVGDMGEQSPNTNAVAAAMQSDNPELFIALGDNSYHGNYPADFGFNYGWAMTANILAPVPGNHDWDIDGTLAAYKAYFDSFIGNNGNNYEVTAGPVHFFIYDTDPRFADGFGITSVQAEWLRAKLLLSTARWKVVLMHRPPYCSDTTHGSDPTLQLPFKDWGADLVVAGHSHVYERLNVDGLTYIVVGTGGRPLYTFGSPVTGSVVRLAAFGRLIGRADCDQITLTFKDVSGAEMDSFTISKG